VFSPNDKRAMNQGFGDGMSRAFELVATPLVFGGIGLLIDRLAGTAPVFVVCLSAFAVIGTFLRAWYGYDAEMRSHEQSGRWASRDSVPERDPDAAAPVRDLWSSRRRPGASA
jgi:F0F1-type ATP synthase assembly protein I